MYLAVRAYTRDSSISHSIEVSLLLALTVGYYREMNTIIKCFLLVVVKKVRRELSLFIPFLDLKAGLIFYYNYHALSNNSML